MDDKVRFALHQLRGDCVYTASCLIKVYALLGEMVVALPPEDRVKYLERVQGLSGKIDELMDRLRSDLDV